MYRFTNEEKLNMIQCYILTSKNCFAAMNMYLGRYPEKTQPSKDTFRRLFSNLKNYGQFNKPVTTRKKKCNEGKENLVLLSVTNEDTLSTREIEKETGVPKSTAHFILKKNKVKSYKYRICHGLRVGDDEKRRTFCEWFTRRCDEDHNFPYKIIWTDESKVTNNGIFNRHNYHYWSTDNQRRFRISRHQNRYGFNIWCGIFGNRIIGPIFFNETLTAEHYLQILRQVSNILDDIPLEEVRNCWFQQDGAPPHNARPSVQYLNEHFPNSWIGTRGPVAWPPRSPDITPMDFFLWGYIKNWVYKHNFNNLQELRNCVEDAFNSITQEMLTNAINSTVRRAYLCLEEQGNIFEYLL